MKYTRKIGEIEHIFEAETSQEIVQLINAVDSTAKCSADVVGTNNTDNATV